MRPPMSLTVSMASFASGTTDFQARRRLRDVDANHRLGASRSVLRYSVLPTLPKG